jgi:hypothetical protein
MRILKRADKDPRNWHEFPTEGTASIMPAMRPNLFDGKLNATLWPRRPQLAFFYKERSGRLSVCVLETEISKIGGFLIGKGGKERGEGGLHYLGAETSSFSWFPIIAQKNNPMQRSLHSRVEVSQMITRAHGKALGLGSHIITHHRNKDGTSRGRGK